VERVHEFCGRDAVGVLCAAGLQEALNGPKGSIPRLDQSGREVRRELGHIAKVKGFRSPTSGSYDRVSRAADDVEVVIWRRVRVELESVQVLTPAGLKFSTGDDVCEAQDLDLDMVAKVEGTLLPVPHDDGGVVREVRSAALVRLPVGNAKLEGISVGSGEASELSDKTVEVRVMSVGPKSKRWTWRSGVNSAKSPVLVLDGRGYAQCFEGLKL
jgi:hypothetical protein